MTDLRGHTFSDLMAGLNAGQHLAVDAVVAFVDGELGALARDRAAEHVSACQSCAAEVAGQRQTRTVVRSAGYPRVPADLLATLRDIPQTAGLPAIPDGLAVAEDGTVVTVADAGCVAIALGTAPLGTAAPLGAGPRWGTGLAVLGCSALGRRIGRTGAGAVVSGLVLGALIMAMLEDPVAGTVVPQPEGPSAPAWRAPSVVPAVGMVPRPGEGASVDTALLHMTTQPGRHGVQLPR